MTHRNGSPRASGVASSPPMRAGIGGLAVALWYAAPDYLHRRGPRILAKTAIVGVAAAAFAGRQASGYPGSSDDTAESNRSDQQSAQSAPVSSEAKERMRTTDPQLLIGVGGLLLVVGIGINIATERWIHRFGERLSRKGAVLPHTAIGLIAGSLTVLAGLDELPARRHQVEEVDGRE